MKKEIDTEGRQKVTNDSDNDHTQPIKAKVTVSDGIDPRIIELVRFLARSAAEKDYAELLERTRRETQSGSEKETLQ